MYRDAPSLGLGLGLSLRQYGSRFTGLLDAYTGAAAAYSLRKLSSSTSNVVRVRRSLDDAEQDFTAAQVADGTLTTFCGVADGFVSTWYDQSGNGNNAVQATTTSQPKIVASGALVAGGLDFDGVDDALTASSSLSSQPCTLFYLFSKRANGIRIYDFATNEVRGLIAGGAGVNEQSIRAGLLFLPTYTATDNQQYLRADLYNGSSSTVRVDGAQNSGNAGTDIPSGNLSIGGSTGTINGTIGEMIVYPDSQSSNLAAIQAEQNDYYGIY